MRVSGSNQLTLPFNAVWLQGPEASLSYSMAQDLFGLKNKYMTESNLK